MSQSSSIVEKLRLRGFPPRPYPGLRPFQADEYSIFFGREKQVKEVTVRLHASRFAAILGGSGCGKSSLVRAGVIPTLMFYGLPGHGDFWLPVQFTPGTKPIEHLARAFAALLDPPRADAANSGLRLAVIEDVLQQQYGLAALIREFEDELRVEEKPEEPEELRKALRSRANFVFLVDQFEEIFRPENHGNPEVQQLVNLIVAAVDRPDQRVFLILTMRSEDLHSCAAFLGLPEVLNAGSYLVPRLTESELERAVLEPANRFAALRRELSAEQPEPAAVEFDVDVMKGLFGAVEIMKNDPDHLPLLQHLLFQLWEAALRREGKSEGFAPASITVKDLDQACGGGKGRGATLLQQSLDFHAQQIYSEFGSERQKVAETMFRLMGAVDSNGVYKRRWTRVREIVSLSAASETQMDAATKQVDAVIERFSAPHPYIRQQGDGNLDVAHESFIRNWQTLREWVDHERNRFERFRELIDRFKEWRDRSPLAAVPWLAWLGAPGELLDKRAVAELSAYRIDRLGAWADKYSNALAQEAPRYRDRDGDAYREAVRFFSLSVWRPRIRSVGTAFVGVVLVVLGGWLYLQKQEQALLDSETRALQSYAAFAASGSAVELELPFEERAMRLWEALVAWRALADLDAGDGGWMAKFTNEDRWGRLMTAQRLSHATADQAFRRILAWGVWPIAVSEEEPTGQAETAPTSKTCAEIDKEKNDDPRIVKEKKNSPHVAARFVDGQLYSHSDGRHLFLVPAEGSVHLAALHHKDKGSCKLSKLLFRVERDAELQFDPDLRLAVVRGPQVTERSQPYWEFYRVTWMPVCSQAATGAQCVWQAHASLAGSFDDKDGYKVQAWGIQPRHNDGTNTMIDEYVLWKDLSSDDGTTNRRRTGYRVFYDQPVPVPIAAQDDVKELIETKGHIVGDGHAETCDEFTCVRLKVKDSVEKEAGTFNFFSIFDQLKKHSDVTDFPIGQFRFQGPRVTRIASGERDFDGYLLIEAENGQYFSVPWSLKRLRRSACDVFPFNAQDEDLLKEKERNGKFHPTFAVLAGPNSHLRAHLSNPCDKQSQSSTANK